MDTIKTITTTLLLTATAATAQHSGDPQDLHQDFDFLAAWDHCPIGRRGR